MNTRHNYAMIAVKLARFFKSCRPIIASVCFNVAVVLFLLVLPVQSPVSNEAVTVVFGEVYEEIVDLPIVQPEIPEVEDQSFYQPEASAIDIPEVEFQSENPIEVVRQDWMPSREHLAFDVESSVGSAVGSTDGSSGNEEKLGGTDKLGPETTQGFFGYEVPQTGRVVFVLDISSSMMAPMQSNWTEITKEAFKEIYGRASTINDGRKMTELRFSLIPNRLGLLKDQTRQAINDLGENVEFGIIAFHSSHVTWGVGPGGQLMPASALNRRNALNWVESLTAEKGTEPLDPLRLALDINPDLIFFVTDGEFSERHMETVTRRNRFREIPINIVGIDSQLEQRAVLEEMAVRNSGQFTFVEKNEDEEDL